MARLEEVPRGKINLHEAGREFEPKALRPLPEAPMSASSWTTTSVR